MADKPNKIGGKKIGGVKKATESSAIEVTQSVSDVDAAQKAGKVGGVRGVGGGKHRSTRAMTIKEREKLFSIISEEADKLFKKSKISPEQREIIENAVKMAVDSGLAEEPDDDDEEKPKKKKKKNPKEK